MGKPIFWVPDEEATPARVFIRRPDNPSQAAGCSQTWTPGQNHQTTRERQHGVVPLGTEDLGHEKCV